MAGDIYSSNRFRLTVQTSGAVTGEDLSNLTDKAKMVPESRVVLGFDFRRLPEVLNFFPVDRVIMERRGVVYIPKEYLGCDDLAAAWESAQLAGYCEVGLDEFSEAVNAIRADLLDYAESGRVAEFGRVPGALYRCLYDLMVSRMKYPGIRGLINTTSK